MMRLLARLMLLPALPGDAVVDIAQDVRGEERSSASTDTSPTFQALDASTVWWCGCFRYHLRTPHAPKSTTMITMTM